MNETTRAKALEILEGMRTIANADMMQRVGYLSDTVVNPRRTRAICRGHQACAIGSLWLAAGVPIQWDGDEEDESRNPYLEGVDNLRDREDFLKHRHALRHAYNVLNDAATEYTERHGVRPESCFRAPVEALFESGDPHMDGDNRRKAMLKVISAAKRKLKAA